MSVTRIATRYAKSLIDLASEQGKLERTHTDIKALQAATHNHDLMQMLKSPIIKGDQKNAVLKTLFGDQLDTLTMAYMTLLVEKGREGYLPEIAAEFINQYKTIKKITTIRVTTAAPMTEAVLEELRIKILASGATSENLEIETHIDPEIIGGFILEFDQKRYDASVARKLEQLNSQFTKNLYIKEF